MNSLSSEKTKTKTEKNENFKKFEKEFSDKFKEKLEEIKQKVEEMDASLENFKNAKKDKYMSKEVEDSKVDKEKKSKNLELPIARIKKIMKLDEEVKFVSAESPVLFAKACELFIIELAYRSWVKTLDDERKTIQKADIANAISRTEYYDFLIDIVDGSSSNKILLKSSFNCPLNDFEGMINQNGFNMLQGHDNNI